MEVSVPLISFGQNQKIGIPEDGFPVYLVLLCLFLYAHKEQRWQYSSLLDWYLGAKEFDNLSSAFFSRNVEDETVSK